MQSDTNPEEMWRSMGGHGQAEDWPDQSKKGVWGVAGVWAGCSGGLGARNL